MASHGDITSRHSRPPRRLTTDTATSREEERAGCLSTQRRRLKAQRERERGRQPTWGTVEKIRVDGVEKKYPSLSLRREPSCATTTSQRRRPRPRQPSSTQRCSHFAMSRPPKSERAGGEASEQVRDLSVAATKLGRTDADGKKTV